MYKSENLLVLHLTTLAVHCPTCLNYMDIAAKCPTMRPVSAEEALLDYFVPFPATTTTPSSSSSTSVSAAEEAAYAAAMRPLQYAENDELSGFHYKTTVRSCCTPACLPASPGWAG